MPSTIKVIKLQNGDEIVGVVEIPEEADQEFELDDYEENHLMDVMFIRGPFRIQYEYDHNRIPHLYLLDWIPSTDDDTYAIQCHQIVTMVNASEQLQDLYCQVALSRFDQDEMGTVEDLKEIENRAMEKILRNFNFDDDDIQ